MTYTVTAVRKITDSGDQTITETNKTEAQRDKFIKKWESVGYSVSYKVESAPKSTAELILAFHNEHIGTTAEVDIKQVQNWLSEQ